jgi:hypothetical protein
MIRSKLSFISLLAVACAAFALALVPHAPALADSSPQAGVCGTVDLAATSGSDAAKAFDCFSSAFAGCKPATLYASGQDAGVPTAWTFTTVDGGDDHGCSVSEVVEKQNGATKTTDAYLCRTLTRDKDGLRLSGCGAQKDVSLYPNAMLGASASATPAVVQQPDPSKS